MTKVCVITGGGSGMGLEAAKLVDRKTKVLLAGRTLEKLENAASGLMELGLYAEPFVCDTSDAASVASLAEHAEALGTVKTVINAAGVSPHMADAEKIFSVNAVGTINVDEAFGPVVDEGGCILNVSSMSAYMLPADKIPTQLYELAFAGAEAFMAGAREMLAAVPAEMRTGTAYSVSKNFVKWFTEREAVKFGKRGVRVVSVSPGTFMTPMGEVEGEEAAGFAERGALGRVGDPAEIARLMAFVTSDAAGYLTGADILYDGGAIAALHVSQAQPKE